MEPQKFVVRLLDQASNLLAWSEVYATPAEHERAASCPFWPVGTRTTQFIVDADGVASEITVHWCELDVARRNPILEPVAVKAGTAVSFTWLEPVWLVPGTRDVPLPAVTVKQAVSISVKPGSLAAAVE